MVVYSTNTAQRVGQAVKTPRFYGCNNPERPAALSPAFPAARLSGAPTRHDEAAAYQLMARSAPCHDR